MLESLYDPCSLYAKFESAYRENHPTETALLRVHSDIVSAIDGKEFAFLFLLLSWAPSSIRLIIVYCLIGWKLESAWRELFWNGFGRISLTWPRVFWSILSNPATSLWPACSTSFPAWTGAFRAVHSTFGRYSGQIWSRFHALCRWYTTVYNVYKSVFCNWKSRKLYWWNPLLNAW